MGVSRSVSSIVLRRLHAVTYLIIIALCFARPASTARTSANTARVEADHTQVSAIIKIINERAHNRVVKRTAQSAKCCKQNAQSQCVPLLVLSKWCEMLTMSDNGKTTYRPLRVSYAHFQVDSRCYVDVSKHGEIAVFFATRWFWQGL